jgi:hypothetical protein
VPYRPGELTATTFMRGGEGWNFHQGPSLYEYPDGRLFLAWAVYDIQECSNDGGSLYSVSDDGGETWRRPELWLKVPNAVTWHTGLLQLRGTHTVLMTGSEGHFVGAVEDARHQRTTRWADYGSTLRRAWVRTSQDEGSSWGPAVELDPELVVDEHEDPFYGVPYQMQQLSNGEVLLTLSYLHPKHRRPQRFHVAVLRSLDQGQTWQKDWDFTVPEERGAMEPWLVEVEDGQLFGIVRNKSGFLYTVGSSDYGRSWQGPERSTIPTVESMSRVIRLQSSALLLVWNNHSSPAQLPRHPLVAALSGDGGQTWGPARVLAEETGLNQLSNFDVKQLRDGRILVCASHYQAQDPRCSDLYMLAFDEPWLRS